MILLVYELDVFSIPPIRLPKAPALVVCRSPEFVETWSRYLLIRSPQEAIQEEDFEVLKQHFFHCALSHDMIFTHQLLTRYLASFAPKLPSHFLTNASLSPFTVKLSESLEVLYTCRNDAEVVHAIASLAILISNGRIVVSS